uniref:Myotubularin phosphatase domain-containing protein n=1 Tax=Gongylonema pulchrum TaxID=637853 RepID=A0A183EPJ8_9BILA
LNFKLETIKFVAHCSESTGRRRFSTANFNASESRGYLEESCINVRHHQPDGNPKSQWTV